ncbi:MAG: Vitamin epoxide reductase [Verrucomicrobiales bacterium]|nr:Vitamin epoxide reductase [Verrucomicrobiales bacterium]
MSKKRFKVPKPPQSTQSNLPARSKASRAIWIGRGCLFGAAGVVSYLLWYSITKQPMAGCGPGSSCDKVMGSQWAYWLGIPVSAPALAAYSILLISSFLTTGARRPSTVVRAWQILTVAGIATIASAIWFTFLQAVVLKSICKFCTSAHVLGFAGVLCLLSQAPYFSAERRKSSSNPGFSGKSAVLAVLIGLLAFAALPIAQELKPEKINIVRIHRGAFDFDLREVPLIGSPDAAQFIVTLFDYTCPSCQEMHRELVAARAKMSNVFSVVALPLPLDPRCNSMLTRTKPIHMQACDYARLGLAIRRAGLEPYEQYDQWFFNLSKTPSLEEARQHAIQLIGKAALDKNITDPWIDKTIQTSVAIYAKNDKEIHSLQLPQLIIGNAVIAGPIHGVDQLVNVLTTNLAKISL